MILCCDNMGSNSWRKLQPDTVQLILPLPVVFCERRLEFQSVEYNHDIELNSLTWLEVVSFVTISLNALIDACDVDEDPNRRLKNVI